MPTLEERPPEAASGLAGGTQQASGADPVMPESDDSNIVEAALSLLPDDASGDADPDDTFRALAHFAEDGVMNAAPAGQRRGAKSKQSAEPNAALRVVLYKNNEVVDTWDSLAVWEGEGSASFRATKLGGKWNWNDPAGRSFKVNTKKDGSGGQSVEAWGARGDMILIHMQPIDAVTVDKNAKKSHLPPGHATDEQEAGDGSTDRTAPDGEGKTGSTKPSSGAGDSSEGGGKKSTNENDGAGSGSGEGGDDSDAILDEILASEEEIANDLEARIGVDPNDSDQESDGDGTGVVGGSPDGRTGTDTQLGGTGPGGEKARSDGKGEGSEDKSGGGANEGGTRDGKDTGSEGGMVGGTEGETGDGVPMGSPFGQFGVPDSLKGLVDVALIVSSANVLSGGQFFQKGIKKGATALSTRNALAKQARHAAAKRHKKVMAKLKKSKKWKEAKPPQRAAIERKILWDYQRKYFDDYLDAAKRSRSEASKKLAKSPKNKSAQKQLADADLAIEAATVKPLAGRLPINHEFAGKNFPVDRLPKKYQSKGVKFSDEGFPDFEPHAMVLPTGGKTVPIKMTGSRAADEAAANAAMRKVDPKWTDTPGKHTWHHLEDGKTMMLVPEDLHDAVRHAGGVARYKQQTGAAVYGK